MPTAIRSVRRRDLDHVPMVKFSVSTDLSLGAHVVGVEESLADIGVQEVREVLGGRPVWEDETVLQEGPVFLGLASPGEHRDSSQFLEQRGFEGLLDARAAEVGDELPDLFEPCVLLFCRSAVTVNSSSPGR